MLFNFSVFLVFLVALLLEGLGSLIAILGFAQKSNFILISILISLDIAKILIANVLFQNWKILSWKFKAIFIPSLLVLMAFTSGGAFGYVSKEFTKIMLPQEQNKLELASMQRERDKLEARKKEIDEQINRVPDNAPTQRRKLMEAFAPESDGINQRINALDTNILSKEKEISQSTTDGGTILAAAKTLGTSPEQVIKYFALLITSFLDPLAIMLFLLGNYLIENKELISKLKQKKKKDLLNNISIETEAEIKIENNNHIELELPLPNNEVEKEVKKNEEKEIVSTESVLNLDLVVNKPLESEKIKKFNKKKKIKEDSLIENKDLQMQNDSSFRKNDLLDTLSVQNFVDEINKKQEENKNIVENKIINQEPVLDEKNQLKPTDISNNIINSAESEIVSEEYFGENIDTFDNKNEFAASTKIEDKTENKKQNIVKQFKPRLNNFNFKTEKQVIDKELNEENNAEKVIYPDMLPNFQVPTPNSKKPFQYDFSVKNMTNQDDLYEMDEFINSQAKNNDFDDDPI